MGDQSLLERASLANAEAGNVTVSINPATLEKLGHVDNTDLARLPAMFSAARSAQTSWATKSFAERASHIKKMRDYIVANAEELATIVARDNGKSRVDALATEVLPCALACNWYMKNAAKVLKPKISAFPASCSSTSARRSAMCRWVWSASSVRGTIPCRFRLANW